MLMKMGKIGRGAEASGAEASHVRSKIQSQSGQEPQNRNVD